MICIKKCEFPKICEFPMCCISYVNASCTWVYVQPIAFGVSCLQSQISMNDLILLRHMPLKRDQ